MVLFMLCLNSSINRNSLPLYTLSLTILLVKVANYGLYFIFLFYFSFHLSSILFYFLTQSQDFSMRSLSLSQLSHNHMTQKKFQKVLKQMISYNIVTTYQPYGKYIYFRVGQLQYVHKPWSMVYKVDQFVFRTPSSSLVITQSKVVLLPELLRLKIITLFYYFTFLFYFFQLSYLYHFIFFFSELFLEIC